MRPIAIDRCADFLKLEAMEKIEFRFFGVKRIHVSLETSGTRVSENLFRVIVWIYLMPVDVRVIRKLSGEPYSCITTTMQSCESEAEARKLVRATAKRLKEESEKQDWIIPVTYSDMTMDAVKEDARNYQQGLRRKIQRLISEDRTSECEEINRILQETKKLYMDYVNATNHHHPDSYPEKDKEDLINFFKENVHLDHVEPLFKATSIEDMKRRGEPANIKPLTIEQHKDKTKTDLKRD